MFIKLNMQMWHWNWLGVYMSCDVDRAGLLTTFDSITAHVLI